MPRRPSKPRQPEDPNEAAYRMVRLVTSDDREPPAEREKNPAAVALGKLGGSKGGQERARRLSKKRRAEIAREGASARWKNHKKKG
jgi:hypothetical protein